MAEQVVKCQYAGDVNDEYCKSCNGITMLVNGEEYPCTECTAYTVDTTEPCTADIPVEETPVEEVVEENTSDVSTESQNAHTDVSEADTTDSTEEAVETTTSETTDAQKHDNAKVSYDEIEKEETLLPDGVTVKSLRYMSGCTLIKTEANGKESYYKFSAEEEWAVDESVGSDAEKLSTIREALWDKLNFEIDSQIEEVFAEV